MRSRLTLFSLLLSLMVLAGCSTPEQSEYNDGKASFLKIRRAFKSNLTSGTAVREPVEQPPANTFHVVKYPAGSRELPAYLTPDPGDGKKHPAIIWITGGDCNSIGDVWSPGQRDDDQTAAAYRKAGIVMMFPSLRGGNDNPGTKEGFLGEVDDVLDAKKYLEKQPYVDPHRIYLGGHSTGGTLSLLAAECCDSFRAVFSFGPIDDVAGYGADSGFLPFDISNRREVAVRSPVYWLKSIKSPVWVIEGEGGNAGPLRHIESASKDNRNIHCILIQGATHFNTLAPTNELIASKIVQDTGSDCTIDLSSDEVNRNFSQPGGR